MIPVKNNLNALLKEIDSTTTNYEETLKAYHNKDQNSKEKFKQLLKKTSNLLYNLTNLYNNSPIGSELDKKTFSALQHDLLEKNNQLASIFLKNLF